MLLFPEHVQLSSISSNTVQSAITKLWHHELGGWMEGKLDGGAISELGKHTTGLLARTSCRAWSLEGGILGWTVVDCICGE